MALDTWAAIGSVMTWLEATINTEMETLGAPGRLKDYFKGYRDPFRLQRHDAVIVVPERDRVDRQEQFMVLPLDVVFVTASAKESDVAQNQVAYGDALFNALEDDATLGGACWEADATEVDYSATVPGNRLVGITMVTVTVQIEIMEV